MAIRSIKAQSTVKLIAVSLAVFVLSLILLASVELYADHDIDRLNSISQSTQQSLDLANSTYEKIEGADIDIRDYILTSNPFYLKTYEAALPSINKDAKMMQANIPQQLSSDTSKLVNLITGKEAEFTQTIQAFQTSGVPTAVNTFTESEYSTAQVGSTVNDIQLKRNESLISYTHNRNHYDEIISIISPIVLVLDIAIAFLIIYLVQHGQRKELELEKRQSEFTSIASHQLRTPATAIKQYVYLLGNNFYGKLSSKQKVVLDSIDGANNRSINIANSLLYVSVLESGNLLLNKTDCNIIDVLNQSVENYRTTFKNNNIKVVCKIPTKPSVIVADEKCLQLCFDVLLDNVCHYTPSGKQLNVTFKDKNDDVRIVLHDTGIGFNQTEVKQLFNKFSRLESGKLMYPDGSGIGLYLFKNLMMLNNSTYTVQSELNHGTIFTLSFPKAKY